MAKGTHIIHRLILNIEVSGKDMAKPAESAVLDYFERVLLKRIEHLLDDMDHEDHIVLDKIELDLGSIALENDLLGGLEDKLKEVFTTAISGLVSPNKKDNEHFIKLTAPQKSFRTFIYFLKNGRLPWYASSLKLQEETWLNDVYQAVEEDVTNKKTLLNLIKDPVVLARLFAQFVRPGVKKLITLLLNLDEHYIDLVIYQQVKAYLAEHSKNLTDATSFFEKITLLIVLLSAGKNRFNLSQLKKQIVQIPYRPKNSIYENLRLINEHLNILPKELTKNSLEDDEKPRPQATNLEGIFVNQAGLVILHPFLEYFFKDLGLVKNADFVDIKARALAVHLLHYLATGKVNAFEYDLHLEKFFCAWPADEIIMRNVDITKLMCDEAENMLVAVIEHWKALKNTSPIGLQDGFLMRSGKLIECEKPVRLIIEKKDMDVLLATLPWGIGVVKMSWMREPFYVEWL